MPEQEAAGRAPLISRRSRWAIPRRWLRRRLPAACNCKNRPCVAGMPRERAHSRTLSAACQRGDLQGAYDTHSHPERALAGRLRPRVPAGEPVREQVCSRHQGAAGRHRPSWSALWRTGPRSTATRRQEVPAAFNGTACGGDWRRPGGTHLCRRSLAKKGYGGHGL